MDKNRLSTVEPTPQAEQGWMDLVYALSQRTLLIKAKTWYVGANVKDKPQGLTLFTGGFLKYRELCAAAVQDGYRGFKFERVKEATCISRRSVPPGPRRCRWPLLRAPCRH